MKRELFRFIIPALIIAGFTFQSCGNIDIVKRRYRPGFHVDVKGKKANDAKIEETILVDSHEPEPIPTREAQTLKVSIEVDETIDSFDGTAIASLNVSSEKEKISAKKVNDFLMTPVMEIKRQKLDSGLKRAVFNKDDEEKYGWSKISFVSTGLGVVGLALLITGIVLLAGAIFGSGFLFWWLFLVLGLLLGIGAMVTGIIGLRQTGSGEKKGRGFALGGMIAGIVSLAGALIALFWGLIYSIISGFNEDF